MEDANVNTTRCPNCGHQWHVERLVRGSLGQCPACGVEVYLAPGISQRFRESVSLGTFERLLQEPGGWQILEPHIARELGLRRAAEEPRAMLAPDGTRLTTAQLHEVIQRNRKLRSQVYQLYMHLAHAGELWDV